MMKRRFGEPARGGSARGLAIAAGLAAAAYASGCAPPETVGLGSTKLEDHCAVDLPTDVYTIERAEAEGDALKLHLRYNGECAQHLFGLCWSGTLLLTSPPSAVITLHHDARNDPCRAEVEKDLSFDLTPLRAAYATSFLESSGEIVIQLREGTTTVDYRF